MLQQGWVWIIQQLDHPAVPFAVPFLALLAALSWVHYRFTRRAAARQRSGMCTRCGRTPAAVTLQDFERPLLVCEECALATQRTHATAYAFFMVMAGIPILLALGSLTRALVSQRAVDWKYVSTGVAPALINSAVVLRLRWVRRRNRPEIDLGNLAKLGNAPLATKLVNVLLVDSLKHGASDIHIAPAWCFSLFKAQPGVLKPPQVALDVIELSGTQLHVKGCTEPGVTVTINGERIPVQRDGSFNEHVVLKVGATAVSIRATGVSGAVTEQQLPIIVPK